MDPAGGPATPGGGRPTGQGRRAGSGSTARSVAVGVVAIALLGIALLLAAGSAGAAVSGDVQFQSDGNDTAAPTVGDLTAVDGTTLELVVEDDADVAEDSIEASDFQVSDGEIETASVSEYGSDATVALELAAPVDSDVVTVAFTTDARITDEAGNRLDTAGISREVDGMDTVPPEIEEFTAEGVGGAAVNVTVRANEPLESADVALDGPETVRLGGENFTSSADGTELTASVALPAAGDYRATLRNLTDQHGNVRASSRSVSVATDDRPPNAVASIDFGASDDLTITVDASRSTAAEPIRSIVWNLGDGAEATGERVTHRYRPGNYTATVTVTDEDGDVGTDDLVLNLQGEDGGAVGSDGRATFGSAGTSNESAVVDVAAPANASVRIAREGAPEEPIAAADGLAIEALTVRLEADARYALAIQADGPAAVADVREATDGRPIGALTIVHDVADDEIANVTIDAAVDRSRVDDLADDPADVRLFRYHAGSWQALDTERLGSTSETYRYRATSPGLSRFAVATDPAGSADTGTPTPAGTATPTETPSANSSNTTAGSTIGVTDASVNRTDVDPGQAVGVSATVTNRGDDVDGFRAGLGVDGDVVDSQSLAVPPGENRTVSLAWTPDSTGSYELVVNGTAAGTVSVGGDGGIVSSILGLFGFLPLGLLETLVTYLGGLLVAVFLALKALALFLGY